MNYKIDFKELIIALVFLVGIIYLFNFNGCKNELPQPKVSDSLIIKDSLKLAAEMDKLNKANDSLLIQLGALNVANTALKSKYNKLLNQTLKSKPNSVIIAEYDSLLNYLAERYSTGLNDSLNKRNLVAYSIEKQECDTLLQSEKEKNAIEAEIIKNKDYQLKVCDEEKDLLKDRLEFSSAINQSISKTYEAELKTEKRKNLFTKIAAVVLLAAQTALFVGVK